MLPRERVGRDAIAVQSTRIAVPGRLSAHRPPPMRLNESPAGSPLIPRLWSPTDNSPITPYLNTYVEKELLADPANASKHFSKRPTSARVTGTREMEGFLERRRDDGRPKSARQMRSEALQRYTQMHGDSGSDVAHAAPCPAGCLADMFQIHEHGTASRSRGRRPCSAKVAPSASLLPSSARRPQSARAIVSDRQQHPAMRPPRAQKDQNGRDNEAPLFARNSLENDIYAPKLKVVGHQRLKTKTSERQKNKTSTGEQWVPGEIFGPMPSRITHTRFNKEGKLFLEGISAAEWSKRRKAKNEVDEIPGHKAHVSSEETSGQHYLEDSCAGIHESVVQEGESFEGEQDREEDTVDVTKMQEEQQRLLALDLQHKAQVQLQHAEEEMEEITFDRLGSARTIAKFEIFMADALEMSDSDYSSDEDMHRDSNSRDTGLNGVTSANGASNVETSRENGLLSMRFNKFGTQGEASEVENFHLISKALNKKLLREGMDLAGFIDFLKDQKLSMGQGGCLTEEQAQVAFDRAKNPVNLRLDQDGFSHAIQDLKTMIDIDPDKIDQLRDELSRVQRHAAAASRIFQDLGDKNAENDTLLLQREASTRQGHLHVAKAQIHNSDGMAPEKEINALRKVVEELYAAVDCFTAAEADSLVESTVKRIVRQGVRMGRLHSDLQQFHAANVLIRSILLLCKTHELATWVVPSDDAPKTCPEAEDALALTRQIYGYSQELMEDSRESLQRAHKSLLFEDFDAVLTGLVVSQALEQDSMIVRGIHLQDKEELLVLVPPEAAIKSINSEFMDLIDVQATDWTWTQVELRRGDAWYSLANKTVEKLYGLVEMYLAQNSSREAHKAMKHLNKVCSTLNLPNPGLQLFRTVETAKRDSEALEQLDFINATVQRGYHYANNLAPLYKDALKACIDADDYRDFGDEAAELTRQVPLQIGQSLRFWESKWLDTGRDVLARLVALGLESLAGKAKSKDQGMSGDKQEMGEQSVTHSSFAECIDSAQKLLEIGRNFVDTLFDHYVASDSVKQDIIAELVTLQRAVNAQLEGQWEALYDEQMRLCADKIKNQDLKATRQGLVRARTIYEDGMKMKIRAQRESNSEFANGEHQTDGKHRIQEDIKVHLPAEWHTIQTKLESMSVDRLARAKHGWLKFSTKLQVMTGCVDFVNLSKLIHNVRMEKMATSADVESDEDVGNENSKPGQREAAGKTQAQRSANYLNLDHVEILERLRKAAALSQSKVLASIANFKQHELEIIDLCKVRLLSAGECMVQQGDVMSSFLVVLRGDVKLVLPFPPELQAANLTEGVEETLEGQENKHGKKGVGRKQRFKSAAISLKQQIQVLRAFGDFALGEVEWSPVQERKINAFGEVVDDDLRTQVAYFGKQRALGEVNVVLQLPYYADIVAMQDGTEILQMDVPSDSLALLQGNSDKENQVKESDDAKQAIQIVRASSSEERSAAFHQSMSQAFRSVRVDIEPLEDVLKNVLGKTGGNSRLLSALSTSSIQALLEGSSVQEYMANEEVLAQDSTFDYMLLIISGVFTMSHYGPSPPSPVCLLAPSNDSETFNPPARTTRMACQSTESSESDTSKDAIENQMQSHELQTPSETPKQVPNDLSDECTLSANVQQKMDDVTLPSAAEVWEDFEEISRFKVIVTKTEEKRMGDVVAEDTLLSSTVFPCSLRCTEQGKVLKISQWALNPLLRAQPSLSATLGLQKNPLTSNTAPRGSRHA